MTEKQRTHLRNSIVEAVHDALNKAYDALDQFSLHHFPATQGASQPKEQKIDLGIDSFAILFARTNGLEQRIEQLHKLHEQEDFRIAALNVRVSQLDATVANLIARLG